MSEKELIDRKSLNRARSQIEDIQHNFDRYSINGLKGKIDLIARDLGCQ